MARQPDDNTRIEGRLRIEILRACYEDFVSRGDSSIGRSSITAISREVGASDEQADHVVRRLVRDGILETSDWHSFRLPPAAALYYEQDVDRPASWRANVLRRSILNVAADAYSSSADPPLLTRDDRGPFEEHTWGEIWGAARTLEALDLIVPRRGAGSIRIVATPRGYDIARVEQALAATLPTSEDEEELAAEAFDHYVRLGTGLAIIREGGSRTPWLVTWLPDDERDPAYPGFTLSSSDGDFPTSGGLKGVRSWIATQPWALRRVSTEPPETAPKPDAGEPLDVPRDEYAALREKVRMEHGVLFGFTSEPDGSFSWAIVSEAGDVLKHGVSDTWEDAKIDAVAELQPPSDEGKV